MADGAIRLDIFLWYARLAKTRSVAQAIIAKGHLRLDGRVTDRAHAPVRVGSVLALPLAERVRIFRVEALPTRRGPAAEAATLYTDLSPQVDAGAVKRQMPGRSEHDPEGPGQ